MRRALLGGLLLLPGAAALGGEPACARSVEALARASEAAQTAPAYDTPEHGETRLDAMVRESRAWRRAIQSCQVKQVCPTLISIVATDWHLPVDAGEEGTGDIEVRRKRRALMVALFRARVAAGAGRPIAATLRDLADDGDALAAQSPELAPAAERLGGLVALCGADR